MRAGGKRWLLSGPRSSFGAAGFPWSDLLQLVFYFVCPRGLALTPPLWSGAGTLCSCSCGCIGSCSVPFRLVSSCRGGCLQSHRVTDSGERGGAVVRQPGWTTVPTPSLPP